MHIRGCYHLRLAFSFIRSSRFQLLLDRGALARDTAGETARDELAVAAAVELTLGTSGNTGTVLRSVDAILLELTETVASNGGGERSEGVEVRGRRIGEGNEDHLVVVISATTNNGRDAADENLTKEQVVLLVNIDAKDGSVRVVGNNVPLAVAVSRREDVTLVDTTIAGRVTNEVLKRVGSQRNGTGVAVINEGRLVETRSINGRRTIGPKDAAALVATPAIVLTTDETVQLLIADLSDVVAVDLVLEDIIGPGVTVTNSTNLRTALGGVGIEVAHRDGILVVASARVVTKRIGRSTGDDAKHLTLKELGILSIVRAVILLATVALTKVEISVGRLEDGTTVVPGSTFHSLREDTLLRRINDPVVGGVVVGSVGNMEADPLVDLGTKRRSRVRVVGVEVAIDIRTVALVELGREETHLATRVNLGGNVEEGLVGNPGSRGVRCIGSNAVNETILGDEVETYVVGGRLDDLNNVRALVTTKGNGERLRVDNRDIGVAPGRNGGKVIDTGNVLGTASLSKCMGAVIETDQGLGAVGETVELDIVAVETGNFQHLLVARGPGASVGKIEAGRKLSRVLSDIVSDNGKLARAVATRLGIVLSAIEKARGWSDGHAAIKTDGVLNGCRSQENKANEAQRRNQNAQHCFFFFPLEMTKMRQPKRGNETF